MANTTTILLGDKDVRNLMSKDKKYMRVVGDPKELHIRVNPTGIKTFMIRIRKNKKDIEIKLGEFRPGIYSVTQARKDAMDILNEMNSNNKSAHEVKGNTYKYKIKNLCEKYIDLKLKKGNSPSYIRKISQRLNNFIILSLGHLDAKAVTYSMLIEILTPIFDPENPNKSRLETIHRLISDLHSILLPAIRDGYLTVDPTMGLHKTFPTTASFAKKNGIDRRIPALTDELNF